MQFTRLYAISAQKPRNSSAWTGAARRPQQPATQPGFTIVELLIVIVIIGILAAITVVAYNGIQQRAKSSTVMADLANSAKKMALDNVNSGSYALAAAAVDGGNGLPTSSGTTYQFHSTGSTYCITGTNGSNSYTISDTATTPTQGGCAGDGVGGVAAITNLAPNPSFEIDIAAPWAKESSITTTYDTTNKSNGSRGLVLTKTATGTAQNALYVDIPVKQGFTYVIAYSLKRLSASGDYEIEFRQVSNQIDILNSGYLASPASITRSSVTGTASATGSARLYVRAGSGAIGDAFMIDSLMITEGPSSYNYADGSSPSWIWNGTPNNSTSTGPPQ